MNTNIERRINKLESLKSEMERKRNFINELAEQIKTQEFSNDIMDVLTKMQYVTLELGQIEVKIKHTEMEIKLIENYENVRG